MSDNAFNSVIRPGCELCKCCKSLQFDLPGR